MNAGFAIYDGYKAYKSDKGWKGALKAGTKSLIGFGKISKVGKVVKFLKGTNKKGQVTSRDPLEKNN